jgi:hypothetical protein
VIWLVPASYRASWQDTGAKPARANALVRRALSDLYRRYGEEFWRTKNEANLGEAIASAFRTYASDDALDYQVIEQSRDALGLDVTRCRYAEFYKELGEPELGFLLVCTADFAVADGFDPDIKLTRTQTIIQGAPIARRTKARVVSEFPKFCFPPDPNQ